MVIKLPKGQVNFAGNLNYLEYDKAFCELVLPYITKIVNNWKSNDDFNINSVNPYGIEHDDDLNKKKKLMMVSYRRLGTVKLPSGKTHPHTDDLYNLSCDKLS